MRSASRRSRDRSLARRIAMASAFAVILSSLLPLAAQATTYGGAGRIAFSGLDPSGYTHIWSMNADGSDKIDLTPGSTDYNIDADWSPDGAAIVFSRGPSFSAADIWRMDPTGGNLVQLTTATPREKEPEWSPDGSRIIFESGSAIVTISASDGSDRSAVGKGRTPSYAPNGLRIVFARSSDIFSMKADGSDVRNLTRTPSIEEFNPDWAPDGRTIAFQRSLAGDHDIWTMRPDGSRQYRVTRNGVFDGFPSYSPDGTSFVVVRDGKGITRISASGAPATSIAPPSMLGEEYTTSWQPLPCTVTGTTGDDLTLAGTAGSDVICALAGDDVIHGLEGDDTIIAGGGSDVAYGDGGNDTIAGGNGADELVGGLGDDRLTGDGAKDILRGGADNDYLFAWDRVSGDRLLCGPGFNRFAWDLNDVVRC